MQSNTLSWSLVIATYNRRDVLIECLGYVVRQTRRPLQIIIVDSSPDAEETRCIVLDTYRDATPETEWTYLASANRSAASQRNEGLPYCRGDIVFFIDDDCLMFPDYAEVMLGVYEADAERRLVGVAGTLVDSPPRCASPPASTPRHATVFVRVWQMMRWRTWSLINHYLLMNSALSHFYPYTGRYPSYKVPEIDTPWRLRPIRVFGAGRATFPRNIILEEQFDDGLCRYAAAEDLDLCYRVSRHGPMVIVREAMLYHMEHPAERPLPYTVALTRVTNVAYLIHKNNPEGRYVKIGYRIKMVRRALSNLIFDLIKGDFGLPRFRGVLDAWKPVSTIFSLPPEQLRSWYREYQDRIFQTQS